MNYYEYYSYILMNAKFGYCHGEIASSCGEVEEAGHHEVKKTLQYTAVSGQ